MGLRGIQAPDSVARNSLAMRRSYGCASVRPAVISTGPIFRARHRGKLLWVLYMASIGLILLGGTFAYLTIALMGQDGLYLQLLEKEKHWVLLSNAIANESLPPLLDRILGSIAAVVGSTLLIVRLRLVWSPYRRIHVQADPGPHVPCESLFLAGFEHHGYDPQRGPRYDVQEEWVESRRYSA
ncbi:duf21 and cbs domain protein [Fusarium oxysporum f. sp. phaseoli]